MDCPPSSELVNRALHDRENGLADGGVRERGSFAGRLAETGLQLCRAGFSGTKPTGQRGDEEAWVLAVPGSRQIFDPDGWKGEKFPCLLGRGPPLSGKLLFLADRVSHVPFDHGGGQLDQPALYGQAPQIHPR